jgi:hypothetical protein
VAVPLDSLQRVLASRCGALLTAAGLDGSEASTAWLDPIASGARFMGVALADPTTVTEADLEAVAPGQVSQLLDLAELRALESALYNNTAVDQRISLGEQKLGQVRADLLDAIKLKTAYLQRVYQIGAVPLAAGTINLNFAETYGDGANP